MIRQNRGWRKALSYPGLPRHLSWNGAPVAQLDRASDFGSEGWGFESLRVRQIRRDAVPATPALRAPRLLLLLYA